jgi:hypothetical protein
VRRADNLINIINLRNYGPGVDSASNRNEYQEYFLGGKGSRCVGLTTLLTLLTSELDGGEWATLQPGKHTPPVVTE